MCLDDIILFSDSNLHTFHVALSIEADAAFSTWP